jgi:hypothetical protein
MEQRKRATWSGIAKNPYTDRDLKMSAVSSAPPDCSYHRSATTRCCCVAKEVVLQSFAWWEPLGGGRRYWLAPGDL